LLEGLLGAITVGIWLAVVPLFFTYLFVLKDKSEEERITKKMYRWGMTVYLFGIMPLTLGNMFFTMNERDYLLLCDFISENLPQILGISLWVTTVLFFTYFFKVRKPSQRARVEKEVRGGQQP